MNVASVLTGRYMEAFILDGDRALDLIQRRLDDRDAGCQGAVDHKAFCQLSLMDHQPRSAGEVTVLPRKNS